MRPDDAAHLADTVVFCAIILKLLKLRARMLERLAEESFDPKQAAAQLLAVFERVGRQTDSLIKAGTICIAKFGKRVLISARRWRR